MCCRIKKPRVLLSQQKAGQQVASNRCVILLGLLKSGKCLSNEPAVGSIVFHGPVSAASLADDVNILRGGKDESKCSPT